MTGLLGRPGLWLGLVAVAVLLGGMLVLGRSGAVEQVWYFDLDTRELFPGPYAAAPPIAAPSGTYNGPDAEDCAHEAGVLAMVVGPRSGGELQTVYLLRYTRESRELRKRQLEGEMLEQADAQRMAAGMRIAAPPERPDQPVTWHTMGSPAGKAVMDRFDRLMGAGQVVLRLPGD